jgi:hypothetical protein
VRRGGDVEEFGIVASSERRAPSSNSCPLSSYAQRTAVKQRPHQETRRYQVATSEPVVVHHGREGGRRRSRGVRPSVFNGLLGGAR